jgi:hypothetical protein
MSFTGQSGKRKANGTKALSDFGADLVETDKLCNILPGTNVGPGSYSKGQKQQPTKVKRIILNTEMKTSTGSLINNSKCSHPQCVGAALAARTAATTNKRHDETKLYRCPKCLKGPYTKLSDHRDPGWQLRGFACLDHT